MLQYQSSEGLMLVCVLLQGAPLFDNLCRSVMGQPLQPYKPQQQALALISTGDRCAASLPGSSINGVFCSAIVAVACQPARHCGAHGVCCTIALGSYGCRL
jgi:hypothetical protein